MIDDRDLAPDVLLGLARKGPGTWHRLCDRLEVLDQDELSEVRAPLEAVLEAWPDSARKAPSRWLRGAMTDGRAVPALALARTARLADLEPQPVRTWVDPSASASPSPGWAGRLAACSELASVRELSVEMLLHYNKICRDRQTLIDSRYHYLLTEQRLSLKAARQLLLEDFGVFGASELRALLDAPHGFPHLHTLTLDGNLVGDSLVDVLCGAPNDCAPALRHLGLRRNALTASAVERLLSSPLVARLESLDVRTNLLDKASRAELRSSGPGGVKLRL